MRCIIASCGDRTEGIIRVIPHNLILQAQAMNPPVLLITVAPLLAIHAKNIAATATKS